MTIHYLAPSRASGNCPTPRPLPSELVSSIADVLAVASLSSAQATTRILNRHHTVPPEQLVAAAITLARELSNQVRELDREIDELAARIDRLRRARTADRREREDATEAVPS